MKVSKEESNEYFHSRPRESQIGAVVSPQSREIPDRKFLEERFEEFSKQYEGKEVDLPTHWGGYSVLPNRIEFWQGRSNRLHDRIVFEKNTDSSWKKFRVAP